jgi:hypothetical protein
MEEGEVFSGIFQDTLLIAEFKGGMPDVPVYKDIDIQELTGGEEKPVFVTLPIGKANAKSGNQRYYDEAFLVELEKQVQELKPIGLMGHLSEDQRAFAFPAEAVHWIGTLRMKEYLLGKGYVPSGDSRQRLQRYRATQKKIATSIDARGDGVWSEQLGAYKMIASTLVLNQIDIAPADRAGIGDLSAVPLLTQEMVQSDWNTGTITVRKIVEEKKKVTEEEKKQAMLEMTAADASVLPESVRAAIIQEYSREIKEALGLTDGNILDAVKSIQAKDAAREKAAVSSRISEMATTGDKAIKIEAVREMVIDMVEAKNPLTVAEAEKAYAEVLEKPSVKKALDLALQESMGPAQTTPVQNQSGNTAGTDPKMKGKWFTLSPAQNLQQNSQG